MCPLSLGNASFGWRLAWEAQNFEVIGGGVVWKGMSFFIFFLKKRWNVSRKMMNKTTCCSMHVSKSSVV